MVLIGNARERIWRLLLLSSCLLAGAVGARFALGSAQNAVGDVPRFRALEIVNEQGATVISLDTTAGGFGRIRLLDREGDGVLLELKQPPSTVRYGELVVYGLSTKDDFEVADAPRALVTIGGMDTLSSQGIPEGGKVMVHNAMEEAMIIMFVDVAKGAIISVMGTDGKQVSLRPK